MAAGAAMTEDEAIEPAAPLENVRKNCSGA